MTTTPAISTETTIKNIFQDKKNKEIIKKSTMCALTLFSKVKSRKITNFSDFFEYSINDSAMKDLLITIAIDYGADVPILIKSLYDIIKDFIVKPNSQEETLNKILNKINQLIVK